MCVESILIDREQDVDVHVMQKQRRHRGGIKLRATKDETYELSTEFLGCQFASECLRDDF